MKKSMTEILTGTKEEDKTAEYMMTTLMKTIAEEAVETITEDVMIMMITVEVEEETMITKKEDMAEKENTMTKTETTRKRSMMIMKMRQLLGMKRLKLNNSLLQNTSVNKESIMILLKRKFKVKPLARRVKSSRRRKAMRTITRRKLISCSGSNLK